MHGIYVMAIITSLIGLAAYGTALWFITQPEDRPFVMQAAILTLPLSPAVFYVIRVPIMEAVGTIVDAESNLPLAVFIQLLYAPITEELAKLLPLIIPHLRSRIAPQNFVSFAGGLGLGFAIGEVWFLAYQIAGVEDYVGMPFYMFIGFGVERITVMLTHIFFTGAALRGITHGRAVPGILIAMLLHWLGNAPIALIVLDVGGLGRPMWQTLVSLWTTVYSIIALMVLVIWRFPQMAKPPRNLFVP